MPIDRAKLSEFGARPGQESMREGSLLRERFGVSHHVLRTAVCIGKVSATQQATCEMEPDVSRADRISFEFLNAQDKKCLEVLFIDRAGLRCTAMTPAPGWSLRFFRS